MNTERTSAIQFLFILESLIASGSHSCQRVCDTGKRACLTFADVEYDDTF